MSMDGERKWTADSFFFSETVGKVRDVEGKFWLLSSSSVNFCCPPFTDLSSHPSIPPADLIGWTRKRVPCYVSQVHWQQAPETHVSLICQKCHVPELLSLLLTSLLPAVSNFWGLIWMFSHWTYTTNAFLECLGKLYPVPTCPPPQQTLHHCTF